MTLSPERLAELRAIARAAMGEGTPVPSPPRPKGRWLSLEQAAGAVEPVAVQPEPRARGHYLDRTVSSPDEAREVTTYEGYERALFERGAAIDRPDDKPPAPTVTPKDQTIRVPRRVRVIDGAGDRPPKPARWGRQPREDIQ